MPHFAKIKQHDWLINLPASAQMLVQQSPTALFYQHISLDQIHEHYLY